MVAERVPASAEALDMNAAWQVTCERKALLAVATLVTKAAAKPRTYSLPVTANIMLSIGAEGGADVLRLVATNLETALSATVPCVTSDAVGTITAPARDIVKTLKALRSTRVTLSAEYGAEQGRCWVTITDEDASATLDGIVSDEFPLVPAAPPDAPTFVFSGDLWRSITTQVAPCAAEDASRATFQCVNLRLHGGRLDAAATDGYQLATLTGAYGGDAEGEYNVPATAVRLAADALSGGTDVAVRVSGAHAWIEVGGRVIMTRVVEAPFIKYQQVIPQREKLKTVVEVKAAELLRTLKAVPPADTCGYVRFTFDATAIVIDDKRGDAYPATRKASCAAHVSGPTLTTWFSCDYLLRYLASLARDTAIVVRFSEPQFIAAFEVHGNDTAMYYCMPFQPAR